ncbi:hypothetical protein CEXT_680351 [Caerostris extrusa]|uniref:Uncharacterized protein n=1 Tax=Caerostris extrusa TaxID=172846 RepID=A0AAV4N7E3_CAEEX|nr:hypothetical protein CEXT_680351 [Caerostris extrusa]
MCKWKSSLWCEDLHLSEFGRVANCGRAAAFAHNGLICMGPRLPADLDPALLGTEGNDHVLIVRHQRVLSGMPFAVIAGMICVPKL